MWQQPTSSGCGKQGSSSPLSLRMACIECVCCCLSIAPPLPVLLLLPLSSSHIAVHVILAGKGLSWMCPLAALDFEYYLPIFLDGIRCPEDPCQFMARQVGGRGRERGWAGCESATHTRSSSSSAKGGQGATCRPIHINSLCW